MSGAFNPLDFPEDWDKVVLAANITPGKCDVSSFVREHKLDKKMGKGVDGATTTYVGKPPVAGDIKFFLWVAAHFQAWDELRPLLQYDPAKGKGLVPVDIFHPAIFDLGITSVVAEKIGTITHDGNGLYSFSITFSEYKPPPKASAVSTASSSTSQSAGGGTGGATPPGTLPDPETFAMQETAKALAGAAAAAYQ